MMRRFLERAGEFLFPTRAVCLGCGDPSGLEADWLCDRCRAKLKPGVHAVSSVEWTEDGVSQAWFALYYENPAAPLIRQFKYNGVYRLALFFLDCMRPLIPVLRAERFDCVAPVPLHRKRLRERGFNQAELIASLIARELGIPLSTAVKRTRNTRRQAKLPPGERRRNVVGAFLCERPFDGLRVLLVDDVFTTGSTANNCAAAIRDAGAADVQALTIAASRRYRRQNGAVYRKKPAPEPPKS
ncbi:MAG: ComF family protein [Clostridia bacterium]|nr:ComF family protein [Clostridia bacterium]